ncbi:hypothetical protein FRD01_20835 [Microvenator marinus]|uniref:Uncharacterized protein n=1 Tax=Microvenator marinus TaxID=2600177 RepID=A0A5B8XWV4_9DELT|nr:hypothetical protein [Microvenator marinus]QED29637.1 hypothetical protein FRD01_20835 [Microvenator marinus]
MLKYLALVSIFLISCGEDIKKGGSNPPPTNNPFGNLNNPDPNNPDPNNPDSNNSGLCLVDPDCDAGQVCESEQCVISCTTSVDCPASQICVPRDSQAPGSVCVENNVPSTEGYDYIVIRDTTTGESCEFSDPGSDMIAISLNDLEGSVIALFEAFDFQEGNAPNGNDYSDAFQIFDGSISEFGLSCPDSFESTYVASMGCGGFMVGQFVSDGVPVAVESGTEVYALEYGANCGGTPADTFEILLCTDSTAVSGGDYTSCDVRLGGGSGLVVEIVE